MMKMSHVADGALHAYLDGACDERERREIETHLEACQDCRARLDEAAALSRHASELLSELEPLSPRAPAWREIEARAAARSRGGTRRSRLKPLAWAASIVIAFGLGWMSQPLLFVARDAAYAPASAPPAAEPEALRQERFAGQRLDEEAPRDAVGRSAGADASLADQPGAGSADVAGEASRNAAAEAGRRPPVRLQKAAEAETEERVRGLAEGAATDSERQARPRQPATEPPSGAVATRPAEKTEVTRNREEHLAAPLPREAAEESSDALPSATATAALRAMAAEEISLGEFLPVQPAEAAVWLGAPLVTLPELDLQRVEVGPGTGVDGATPGLPLVRMTYLDAAGHQIVLLQQRVRVDGDEHADLPSLRIDPDGSTSYRWRRNGYWLALQAELSSDSLRSLADRVR